MLLIQLTGLSGAGKTTIARKTQEQLASKQIRSEVVDGDDYRKTISRDLGFSKPNRMENIYRLGILSNLLACNGIVTILSAINPYEEARQQVCSYGSHVKTVWIDCSMETLYQRDPKGLYRKASLPDNHPEKINNLSGINDPYEPPASADLAIDTTLESPEQSSARLVSYIVAILEELKQNQYIHLLPA